MAKKAETPDIDDPQLPNGIKASRLYIAVRRAARLAMEKHNFPSEITKDALRAIEQGNYHTSIALAQLLQSIQENQTTITMLDLQQIIGEAILAHVAEHRRLMQQKEWPEIEKENKAMLEMLYENDMKNKKMIVESFLESLGAVENPPSNSGSTLFGVQPPKDQVN